MESSVPTYVHEQCTFAVQLAYDGKIDRALSYLQPAAAVIASGDNLHWSEILAAEAQIYYLGSDYAKALRSATGAMHRMTSGYFPGGSPAGRIREVLWLQFTSSLLMGRKDDALATAQLAIKGVTNSRQKVTIKENDDWRLRHYRLAANHTTLGYWYVRQLAQRNLLSSWAVPSP